MMEQPDAFKYHLQQGEGQFWEFKSALQGKPGNKSGRLVKDINKDIAETLVSFANAEGGTLYVGVEDDKTIGGVPHSEKEIAELKTGFLSLIQDARDFPIKSAFGFQVDGKLVLVYEIKYYRTNPFQLTDGRCLKRVEDNNRPTSAIKIIRSNEEDESRTFDYQNCRNVSEKDIDWPLVDQIASKCFPNSSITAYDFLKIQNLMENGPTGRVFTNAAILLFGVKERMPFLFPKSALRLVQVNGEEFLPGEDYNVIRQDEFMGNIFYLLETAWPELLKFFTINETFNQNFRFENNLLLPESVLRECLVNALAHRCYRSSTDIKIYRFSNAIEFENPGKLLSTMSINNLYEEDFSQSTRNNRIAQTLRQCGIMRELGEGIRRIKTETKDIAPLFRSNHNYFSIKFMASATLVILGNDMEQILRSLQNDKESLAANTMRKLVQSGWYGLSWKTLEERMKENCDKIMRATASFPGLFDERRQFGLWMKKKGTKDE